jgi:hypothetical protein
MNKVTTSFLVAAFLLLPDSPAMAVYGFPAQSAEVTEGGKFEIHPSIGIIAGDDDFMDSVYLRDADSFVIVPRLRYGISDSFQFDVHIGGMIGDLSAFVMGTGLMYQFVSQGRGGPLDFSAFINLDLAIGELDYDWPRSTDLDVTMFTMLSGVLFGHTFKAKNTRLTPYGGLAIGFTFADVDWPGDYDDTEIAFDIIFGFQMAFSKKYKVFTEFDIGPTDGLPILGWQLGLSYTF